jgi:hypothetical protein
MRLYFGDTHVADIQNVFCHAETWFGVYEPVIQPVTGGLECRILKFVEFSKDRNKRTEEQSMTPPSASEFDQFNDLISSDCWSVVAADRTRSKILEAPLFIGGGELSWRVAQ